MVGVGGMWNCESNERMWDGWGGYVMCDMCMLIKRVSWWIGDGVAIWDWMLVGK